MGNENIFYAMIAGFVAAIFICPFFDPGVSFLLFLVLISFIFLIFEKFLCRGNDRKMILLLSLFIMFFSLGGIRYEISNLASLDLNLENSIGKNITAEAVISEEPDIRENTQMLTVDLKYIYDGQAKIPVEGKALISSDLSKQEHYGDLITVSGKLTKPENFSADVADSSSTKEFDYINYLGKDGIYYNMDFAAISVLSGGHGSPIKSFLFGIRDSFIKNINKVISKPESALLSGILLGDKSGMSKDLQNMFRIAGLSHIVVLSGYNITIVSDAIMKMLAFLPRLFSLSFGAIGIILFVVLSGASSTAIRAGIMALIVILGDFFHKKYSAGRALLVAIVIMLAINPKLLVFDVSFELSCLATFAVIYISPVMKRKFKFVPDKFGLRETVSSTISAQFFVLPLILYKMGMLSFVALPANILVSPIVPATMLFGFLTGVSGFVFPAFSTMFSWISFFLLAYVIKISEFFASLPFSWIFLGWFSAPVMFLTYFLIMSWFFTRQRYGEKP